MSIYTITKTGLLKVGDVTVGGPTGAGLSGGEVISSLTHIAIGIMLHWHNNFRKGDCP